MRIKSHEDDSELVERCLAGDFKSWALLAARYSRLIDISIQNTAKRYGLGLSGQDTEDIRQDVLSGLWQARKLETVRKRRSISCWLAIVSANAALEYVRKARVREPIKPYSLCERIEEKELAELIPSRRPGPADEAVDKEAAERIREALKKLPDKERLVLNLNLFHHKKYEDISRILKMPAGTVSSYIRRAKERLRKKLKDLK